MTQAYADEVGADAYTPDAGAAAVVREADCDGRSLYETAKAILSDPERTGGMRTAARGMAVVDAAERIYQTAIELARG